MSLAYPLEPLYDREVSTLKHFPKGVIVFDRDGTLIEDAGQHNQSALLKLLPGVPEALKLLSYLGYGLAIASNQSGLESEKFSPRELFDFNHNLCKKLKSRVGIDIDLIVVCPHLATSNCDCRKPKVGLLEAIRQSGLGEPRLFIGDAESDRSAALAFGVEFLGVARGDILEGTKNWVHVNEFS